MKAKELIELLSQHPEADVIISDYNGGETPFYDVDDIEFYENSYADGEDIRKSAKPNNGLITFILGYKCLPNMNIEIAPKSAEESCSWDTARTYCLFLNFDGKTDWRLPTKEELNQIYQSDNDFGSGRYWASNEESVDTAWSQSFENGSRYPNSKCYGGLYVRPVRDIK